MKASKPHPEREAMRFLIRSEANFQGVEPLICLAFARVETNNTFDPTLEGDKRWHLDVERYERCVPKDSPFRDQPELWHSYGLFQLLAPFHIRTYDEDPRVLLQPLVNAARGVARIGNLARRHGGDLDKMRLHYVFGTAATQSPRRAQVLDRFHAALAVEGAEHRQEQGK